MFSVAVKDHVMVAHSLRGEVFGPAQGVHGATFVVTTEYRSEQLDEDGIVIDIGRAHELLARVLEPLRYKNLDDLDCFAGQNTTTEFLARHIHDEIAAGLAGSFRGSLRVQLEENPMAYGSYEAPIGEQEAES